MQSPTRRPMYPQPWQRWAWTAFVVVSASALTFVPFIIAWQRRVVGWRTVAVYTALSGVIIVGALTHFDFRQWGTFWREVIRYTDWAYLLVGAAHVASLDWPAREKTAPGLNYGAHFEQEATEKR